MSDATLNPVLEEQPAEELDTTPTLSRNEVVKVTNLDFAIEIRADRVKLLWRVVFWAAITALWIAFLRRDSNGDIIAAASITIATGAFLAGRLIRLNYLVPAVWALVGSGLIAITIPIATGNEMAIRLVPFAIPLLIFIIGLLLSPVHTLLVFILGTFVTLFVPSFATNSAYLTTAQFFAVTVSLLSTLLAAQVTGELYQITEWALENYKRERTTAIDLFENRQQLEKSLLRSEILGEKLQDINNELENAKHFRGQFLANMSHELRTPLNAIIGFSETMLNFPMMYENVELPDAYRRDLMQIHNSGAQLLTVINDILDLSKVDAGKLEVNLTRVELDPLIDSVMMTAAGLVGNKPIELRRNLPRRLPDVIADDTRLRQVLINLYSNAVKFTDRGSITISMQEFDNEVQINVTDTGDGIKEDALERIFEEFSQVENVGRDPREGAGLGLTISRKLLNLMDGRIWAESEYGKGATFHVVIPKHDKTYSEREQAEKVSEI